MRIKTILTGVAIMMLIQVAAYAQISISSTPVTAVISTGTAEVAGDIVLTAGPSGAVSDTITIRYGGLPITNIKGTAYETASSGITVTGSAGSGSGSGGWGVTPPQFTVTDAAKGIIEVRTMGAGNPGNTITVSGVRVSVDGSGLTPPLRATVATAANPIFVGGVAGTEVTVITGLTDGIASISTVTKHIRLATTGNKVVVESASSDGSFKITEGFKPAFKTSATTSTLTTSGAGSAATQGTQIRLTFTGLATGDSITLTPPGTTALSVNPVTPTANVTTLSFTTTDHTAKDTPTITFTLTTAAAPLTERDITVTATLFPIEAALPGETTKQPKFTQKDLSTVVASIASGKTNLYLPLVTWVSGFDTGIQVSNTTKDPFGSTEGAIAQEGTVTFYFWANDGSAVITYTTTAGSPGSGLGSAGKVAAGSTYTVLASELLKAAGRTTSFTGYAIAVASFTHGHGNVFVSDFKAFTQGVPALVIPPTSLAGKDRKTQFFETLTP